MEPNQTQFDPTLPTAAGGTTTQEYPVNLTIPYPEQSSRLLALCSLLFLFPKMIILIPHLVALWLLGIVAMFAWIFAQFAVLFTGKHPVGMFDFLVGFFRWQLRVNAYFMGLTDTYPPFSMN